MAEAASKPIIAAKVPANATPAAFRRAAKGYRLPFYTPMTPVVSGLLGMDITDALACVKFYFFNFQFYHQFINLFFCPQSNCYLFNLNPAPFFTSF